MTSETPAPTFFLTAKCKQKLSCEEIVKYYVIYTKIYFVQILINLRGFLCKLRKMIKNE